MNQARLVQTIKGSPLCICGRAGVHMRPRKGGGCPVWRCEEHRNQWPDYTEESEQ
jgi:hypothetical protein